MEKVIALILKDVGIGGIDELRRMGSLQAIHVICKKKDLTCVNMLYALESVIQGVAMDELKAAQKRDLKRKYQQMLKESPEVALEIPRAPKRSC